MMLVSFQDLVPSHWTRKNNCSANTDSQGSELPRTLSEPTILHLKTPQDSWLDKTFLLGKAVVSLQDYSWLWADENEVKDYPQWIKEPCFPCAPSRLPAHLHSSPFLVSLLPPQGRPHPGSPSSLGLGWILSPFSALLRFFLKTYPTHSELYVFCCHPSGIFVLQVLFLGIFSPCPFALYHCHFVTCDSTQIINNLTWTACQLPVFPSRQQVQKQAGDI